MKKRSVIFTVILISVFTAFAAIPVFNIYKTDNKVVNFVLTNIDSIGFESDYSNIKVYKKDGSLTTLAVAEIDSTVFSEGDFTIPQVETVSATLNYTTLNATCQVKVVANGGCTLTERGIVWSNKANPTIKDNKAGSGTSVGSFYAMMSGLALNQTYYVRAYATNCAGTAYGAAIKVQPLMGNVTYTFDQSVIDAGERIHGLIRTAMDSACYYYNRYTSFKNNIWVYYSSGIPTAQASYHGSIGFGSNERYMYVGTAMHEMAHYFGSGTTNVWKALMVGGLWQGATGKALCLQLTGESLKGDNNSSPVHYWPTGINQREEVKSATDLVNHAKVVKAMLVDDTKVPTSW